MTKRIIYTPAEFKEIPIGNVPYMLPVANKPVVDLLVPDSFTTGGTVYYDSLNGPMLDEPFHHQFAGWEVTEEERIAALSGGVS